MSVVKLPIIGFPDYLAGSDGQIYSLKSGSEKKLKQFHQGNGKYLIVVLRFNGKSYTKNVHRLICETFHGKREGNLDASHLNGNREDNRPENLIWENRSANCHRKKDHGSDDIGIKNSRALFNLEQIIQIRAWIRSGIALKEIAERMGVDERIIGKIKRGEHYKGQGL